MLNANSLAVLVAFPFWRRNKGPASSASGASQTNFRGDFVLNANLLVVLADFFFFGGETKDQQAQRAFLGCLSDEFP